MARDIIAGLASLGAVGAAAYVGLTSPHLDVPVFGDGGVVPQEYQICLKNDLRLFEGVEVACYSKAEIAALRDARVLGMSGEMETLMLSHPTDMTAQDVPCTTCREFDAMRGDGWYALTARAMRREGVFARACRLLDAVERAAPAAAGHFESGSPTLAEMSALDLPAHFSFGDPASAGEGISNIEKTGTAKWRIEGRANVSYLEEIANADFDNDGIEEILAFIVVVPDGGTAQVSAIMLMEKDQADGPVTITSAPFTGANADQF